METGTFLWIVVGAGVGWLMSQVSLLFFQDEIFAFVDRLVNRVRGWCGLS